MDQDEKTITDFYTKWDVKKTMQFFGQSIQELTKIADNFVMICLNKISHQEPVHFTNDAFKKFVKGYSQWKSVVSGGQWGIIYKFIINAMILNHQIKQKERYDALKENNPEHDWIKKIDEKIEEYECKDFDQFLKSMYLL